MDRAFDAWFQRVLADPPVGVRRIPRRRSRSQKPRDALRNAAANLAEHRDFPSPGDVIHLAERARSTN